MNVLITQSMLFPWIGMLAQLKLADIVVHYDDVQLSKGSFVNRVQVKTEAGMRWMTIPLRNFRLGMLIDETCFGSKDTWQKSHMSLLSRSFQKSPFKADALNMVEQVYSSKYETIGSLSRLSMIALCAYYRLLEGKEVLDIRSLGVTGSGTNRVLDVVQKVGGTAYITGHGARNYLDHLAFENAGIEVRYMDYSFDSYPQPWGTFTPYVTGLDLVANMGKQGLERITTSSVPWQEFLSS
ncbi:WbqC family protein [Synechococcus sp. AH-551-N17]|nr:WbqC family protein [Synechococcus sp. AH-551-N17]